MRILLVVRTLQTGGTEVQATALAIGLHARGHHVAVATFFPEGPLSQRLGLAQVPVFAMERGSGWDVLGMVRSICRAARDHGAQVVYSFLAGTNVPTALARSRLPGVRIVWGIRSGYMDFRQYGLRSRVVHAWARLLSGRPHLIIANSESGRRLHVGQGFKARRFVVVPNGIDTARFAPSKGGSQRLRAQWGVRDGVPVIGCVARLDPMKDHATLLSALAQVPRAHLICVGGGDPAFTRRLQAKARGLGVDDRVTWMGAVDQPEEVYAGFDVAVLASYGEGFPNAVAEAMSSGVPCVATDVGDVSHIVGKTGRVVPAKDPGALADALQSMLGLGADRLADLGKQARTRIVDQFSIDAMVGRTEELLRCLVSDQPAGASHSAGPHGG